MPSNELSPEAIERRVLGVTSAGHALCHICEMVYPAMIVSVMSEFHLSPKQATAVGMPAIVLFGLGALPAGMWADRRGTREAMDSYFLLIALSTAAVYFARTPGWLCVALTCVGAAMSVYHPAGLAMLSHGCRDRGRAMGINGVAGSAGVALGPAIGIYFANGVGWRVAYAAIAMIAIVCWFVSSQWGVEVRSDVDASPTSQEETHARRGQLTVLAILFGAMLVGGFNYRTATSALPTFLSHGPDAVPGRSGESATGAESQPISEPLQRAGLVVFIVFALGGIGQLTGGLLADRVRPAVLYPLVISATIPCAIMMFRGSRYAGIAAAGALAIFLFAEQPLENTMIANATPPRLRSTVYGLKFILAFGVASVGLVAFGAIWDEYGLRRVFLMYAAGAGLMAVIATVHCVCQRRPRISESG